MSISVNFHGCTKADVHELHSVPNDALQFTVNNDNRVFLYLPPAVAQATADAFNEAMEEHRKDEEMRKQYALYEAEKRAGLHKPQEELDADLRDAGRGHLVQP